MPSRIVNLANFQQFTAINLLTDPGAVGGPVVIPGAIQVTLVWNLDDGKQAHNVLYGAPTGTFTPSNAIAVAILNALTTGTQWTALAAVLSTTTALTAVYLRDVRTPSLPIVGSTSGGAAGTAAGVALPNEVALCVTLRTAQAGRGFRGRYYVPGYAASATVSGNTASAPAVTATQNWAQTVPTALAGSGLNFVLGLRARQAYTGSTGTAHPARSAGTVIITSSTVRDNHWDSQRRRGLK